MSEPVDPQAAEDELVLRHRAVSGEIANAVERDENPVDREEVVERWLRYARSEECHARLMRKAAEQPFDQLRDTRAQVRRSAAELLAQYADVEEAARAMMRRVQQLYIVEPPLLQFDEAMLTYTQARTWQACALELSPGLHQWQPAW